VNKRERCDDGYASLRATFLKAFPSWNVNDRWDDFMIS